MKCQFCNQRCRLLKEGEPEYHKSNMLWLCSGHPTRVLHYVSVSKFTLRRDSSIVGQSRQWTHTTVTWVNDKKQMMQAMYRRDEDKQPGDFCVYHVNRGKERWQDRMTEVFSLPEFPKDFTPENLPTKIAKLAIFS